MSSNKVFNESDSLELLNRFNVFLKIIVKCIFQTKYSLDCQEYK